VHSASSPRSQQQGGVAKPLALFWRERPSGLCQPALLAQPWLN
jgi:hypothetical protein